MSSRNFLEEGLDLSLLPSAASNAQILQAIRESHPALPDLGGVIKTPTTPDISTYPEYVTFLYVNTTTGELKYWNGASWQLITGAASIANNTVTIDKLSVSGATALQLLQVNAGVTAFQWVNPGDLFSVNSIALDKLINAAGAGYVVYSTGGGTWSSALLTDLINAWLAITNIDISQVVDIAGVGLPNQVAYITDTFNSLTYGYADQLLRANQVDTNRLKFAAGNGGKYVKLNAGGTDFDYAATTGGKAAILKYTVATGTAAQTVLITTETPVEWTTLVDTEGAVSALDTATDRFTLATGTYLLDISVPVYHISAAIIGVLILYDVTGTTIVATTTFSQTGDTDQSTHNLKATVKVTAATNVYDVRIYLNTAAALGRPSNLGTYAETYQQMSVLKLT